MKEGIHPNYREVLFSDLSNGFKFVTRSCANTKETETFEGKEYPLYKLDTSSESHPFYTGTQKSVDNMGGRVERFRNRFGKTAAKEAVFCPCADAGAYPVLCAQGRASSPVTRASARTRCLLTAHSRPAGGGFGPVPAPMPRWTARRAVWPMTAQRGISSPPPGEPPGAQSCGRHPMTNDGGPRPSTSRGSVSVLSSARSTASSQALLVLGCSSRLPTMVPSGDRRTSTSARGLPAMASGYTMFGLTLALTLPL